MSMISIFKSKLPGGYTVIKEAEYSDHFMVVVGKEDQVENVYLKKAVAPRMHNKYVDQVIDITIKAMKFRRLN